MFYLRHFLRFSLRFKKEHEDEVEGSFLLGQAACLSPEKNFLAKEVNIKLSRAGEVMNIQLRVVDFHQLCLWRDTPWARRDGLRLRGYRAALKKAPISLCWLALMLYFCLVNFRFVLRKAEGHLV